MPEDIERTDDSDDLPILVGLQRADVRRGTAWHLPRCRLAYSVPPSKRQGS
jgi:hypothetical protein